MREYNKGINLIVYKFREVLIFKIFYICLNELLEISQLKLDNFNKMLKVHIGII